jgi:hypothetical protein
VLRILYYVQENERLAEEVDQMRTGGRAANAREYRSESGRDMFSHNQRAWRGVYVDDQHDVSWYL